MQQPMRKTHLRRLTSQATPDWVRLLRAVRRGASRNDSSRSRYPSRPLPNSEAPAFARGMRPSLALSGGFVRTGSGFTATLPSRFSSAPSAFANSDDASFRVSGPMFLLRMAFVNYIVRSDAIQLCDLSQMRSLKSNNFFNNCLTPPVSAQRRHAERFEESPTVRNYPKRPRKSRGLSFFPGSSEYLAGLRKMSDATSCSH